MTAHRPEPETAELQAELAAARAELAELREAQESVGEREAELVAAKDAAERAARFLSEALAQRLRIDGAGAGGGTRGSGLFKGRQASVTREEAQQLELLRDSSLWDPGFYLRSYPDVVDLGEDPALHFLRHPYYPVRQPSERFDIRQYLIDHPDAVEQRVNPLVHFLLSAESQGADAYPPAPR